MSSSFVSFARASAMFDIVSGGGLWFLGMREPGIVVVLGLVVALRLRGWDGRLFT